MSVMFDNQSFALQEQTFQWPWPGNFLETIGEKLALELSRVGWDIPGIDVNFTSVGKGRDVTRTLRSVSGETDHGPFQLVFNGAQHSDDGTKMYCTGLSKVAISPGLAIEYFNDDDTLKVDLFVGKDWKKQGHEFINSFRLLAAYKREPRTYLRYRGRLGGTILKNDTDLGRDYSPEGFEPKELKVAQVIEQVQEFFDKVLFPKLAALPTVEGYNDVTEHGDANLRRLAKAAPIPVTQGFPNLYTWVETNEACRIQDRKFDDFVAPENDFVVKGNGYRAASLSLSVGNDVSRRVYDGFNYAGTDPSERASHVVYGFHDDAYPVEITLKDLNDIFVVDNAAYDRRIEELRATKSNDEVLTDAELDSAIIATARTFIAAADYDGSFERPTYLIGRQLFDDEARLINGRILVKEEDGRVKTQIVDEKSGAFCIYDGDVVHKRSCQRAVDYARKASDMFYRRPDEYRIESDAVSAAMDDQTPALRI